MSSYRGWLPKPWTHTAKAQGLGDHDLRLDRIHQQGMEVLASTMVYSVVYTMVYSILLYSKHLPQVTYFAGQLGIYNPKYNLRLLWVKQHLTF